MKKLFQNIREKANSAMRRVKAVVTDKTGDLATNTIGAIIVAVVIVGLLIVAVKQFFPDFFDNMFSAMESKLNAFWTN